MDLVDELRAFVATAQAGSFTGAGEQLGLSNRLMSKYVAELETRLGVRLFQRTTRRVGLTAAGEDLLARAPALLDELDDLIAGMTEGTRGFSGTIRVTAPVTFGEIYFVGMLDRFARDHPDLTIDMRLSDRHLDLAAEGIDVAFRIGRNDMLSLKERKLGTLRMMVVASPAYIGQHGAPQTPGDLITHRCIMDTNRRGSRDWVFQRDGITTTIPMESSFHVNSARAVAQLAAEGRGIAYLPRFALGQMLQDGQLTQVLADYTSEAGNLNAVYLEGRTLPRKVRALIDFAARDLGHVGIL